MADPLANSWTKFHWATQHMHAVNQALQRSIDPKAHPVTLKVEIEPRGPLFEGTASIASLPHLRNDCGLAVGDVMHNFRSALDYLAWDLVRIGATPRPAKPHLVQFPATKNYESFRSQLGTKLPGVPAPYRAIVRRYQPYRRGDGPKAIRWLRNFSDLDKHRVLIPTVMSMAGISNVNIQSTWPLASSVEYLINGSRPLDVGTDVFRFLLQPTGHQLQVNMNSRISVFPSLGYGRNILDSLALIRRTVLEILSAFENAL